MANSDKSCTIASIKEVQVKGLMSLLDDVVSSKAQGDGVAQPLDTERKKLKLKGKSRINPPVWWRDNQKQFPVSQKIPLHPSYLCSIGTCF